MLRPQLEKLFSHIDLDQEEMRKAMESIMDGTVSHEQVAAFLAALRSKGETIVEIAEAARVMRDKATQVKTSKTPLIDIVGTGGDGSNSFNISTLSAIVVSASGVAVAKHGNRSVSSRCGSADILEAMDIALLSQAPSVESSIEKTDFGFIFAPYFHKAMKNVVPVRKAMGTRTIFNILGPLTNPARPDYQLLGVFSKDLVRPMAEVLREMGLKRAMVVHGDGMDELSLSGPNHIALLEEGAIKDQVITAEDVGLESALPGYAEGGTIEDNLSIINSILSGETGPRRDVVLLNAGAALYVSGRVSSIRRGVSMAREIVESRLALDKVEEIRSLSSCEETA